MHRRGKRKASRRRSSIASVARRPRPAVPRTASTSSFDHWHSTDSPENVELSRGIYRELADRGGLIYDRRSSSSSTRSRACSCPTATSRANARSAARRTSTATSCEVCGAVYAPTDLKNPYSTLTGATPHAASLGAFFFRLSDPRCVDVPAGDGRTATGHRAAARSGRTRRRSGSADRRRRRQGPADWDHLARSRPTSAFRSPDAPGKYFYVWLDAPVGYLASLKNVSRCRESAKHRAFADVHARRRRRADHFIGKDIVYHHTLFWPAMLEFAGRRTRFRTTSSCTASSPSSGEKMSKSRGTGIAPELVSRPRTESRVAALLHRGQAQRQTSRILDFNPDDFVARVNSDLIGKYVNIASRAARFIARDRQTSWRQIVTGLDARRGVASACG